VRRTAVGHERGRKWLVLGSGQFPAGDTLDDRDHRYLSHTDPLTHSVRSTLPTILCCYAKRDR
jgi:hypothetical protein